MVNYNPINLHNQLISYKQILAFQKINLIAVSLNIYHIRTA